MSLAGDIDPGDFEVVFALAGGEIRVQFAGLGIHQVGGERAGVAAEQACWTARRRPSRSRSGAAGPAAGPGRRSGGSGCPCAASGRTGHGRACENFRCRVTSTGFSGRPIGAVRPVMTATGSTQGTSSRASLRSMWYSWRAACSEVSLMAMTEPPRWAKRTMCREMPRGSAARYSAGQSSRAMMPGQVQELGLGGGGRDAQRTGGHRGLVVIGAGGLEPGQFPDLTVVGGLVVPLGTVFLGHGVSSVIVNSSVFGVAAPKAGC